MVHSLPEPALLEEVPASPPLLSVPLVHITSHSCLASTRTPFGIPPSLMANETPFHHCHTSPTYMLLAKPTIMAWPAAVLSQLRSSHFVSSPPPENLLCEVGFVVWFLCYSLAPNQPDTLLPQSFQSRAINSWAYLEFGGGGHNPSSLRIDCKTYAKTLKLKSVDTSPHAACIPGSATLPHVSGFGSLSLILLVFVTFGQCSV